MTQGFPGAQHDLEALITTHLFVISPNNSGSTFMKNVLATCPGTWNLRREGQNTFGFRGSNPAKLDLPYAWASEPHFVHELSDPTAFDWAATRKAWYFQSRSSRADARVFVEKSPPFLLHVGSLHRHFKNAKFLFMVRNPYATAEGVARGVGSRSAQPARAQGRTTRADSGRPVRSTRSRRGFRPNRARPTAVRWP